MKLNMRHTFLKEQKINGQSGMHKNELKFNIQHRFGPINSGFYNLYGLITQVRLVLIMV